LELKQRPPILRNDSNDASRRENERKQQVAALELGQEETITSFNYSAIVCI
jgi:hypothetical protein